MTRRFVVASALAVVVTAAFLPGSGLGSPAAAVRRPQFGVPASLANAIRTRLGVRTVRSSTAATATTGPLLGASVSLSGDGTTALVGAAFVGGGKGAAYIFHTTDEGAWTSTGIPTATLTNPHGVPKALFGFAVALSASGTTAFVGAPLTGGTLFGPGAIYVFHVSAEDAWVSTSTATATVTASHGTFAGTALALSQDGTTLVAGAPFSDNVVGGAYVFHVSSEAAWASTSSPTATLSDAGESIQDSYVGSAVALSADGTTALVSDSGNPSGGGAYVFHASAENAWTSSSTPNAILSDANSGSTDALGNALALSGDGTVALLGALGANSKAGAADVFHSSGEAAWTSTSTPAATLTPPLGLPGDNVGAHVALSADGKAALVLAPGVNSARGAAYLFSAPGEGSWVSSSAPAATLTRSGARPKDSLGVGVFSADGATALTGAPGVRLQTGEADVFHVSAESSWVSSSTPDAKLTDDALAACVVPKLKGLRLSVAKTALADARCHIGKVTRVPSKYRKSRVLWQNRKPRTRWAIGARVSVRVGK
jgi:hypothetical protein